MKKRLFALLIVACLMLGMIPNAEAAEIASGTCGDTASWVLTDDGTLTISGTGRIYSKLGDNTTWRAYMDLVTNVVIEEGITEIGDWTFSGHKNMTQVSLPSTVYCFGQESFGSSGLTSIVLPEGELTLDMFVFSDCTDLEYVSLKNTVIDSLYYCFSGCTNLKTVDTTGAKVKANCSSYYAFADCVSLTSIDFFTQMEGVTKIGYGAFTRCHGLKEITVPANIRELAYWAVGGDNLKTIIFEGDAPHLAYREGDGDEGHYLWSCFSNISAKCYYPAGNETWTVDAMINYNDGALTWIPYTPGCPFSDVTISTFFYEPVMWALENNITSGASATTFNPNGECLRAQVVTFLWRAMGCPEPTSTENPFTDVKETDFYYDAVLWAVENGITTGTTATTFGPLGVCNRAQVVTFLYRAFESPAVENADNPFNDVPADSWFTAPVLWAVEQGITNGLSATEFGPTANCNRAQVVTFLYRAYTA